MTAETPAPYDDFRPLAKWSLTIEALLHNPCKCCTTLTTGRMRVILRSSKEVIDMWEAPMSDARSLSERADLLLALGIQADQASHAAHQRIRIDLAHAKEVNFRGPGIEVQGWDEDGETIHWEPKPEGDLAAFSKKYSREKGHYI